MAAAAPAVKTEPIAEIDIKEEPLDAGQQEALAAQSPSVAAAQKLLQHQLSGIKNTLKGTYCMHICHIKVWIKVRS